MRRAKESLLVLAASALFTFGALLASVQATPQAASAAGTPRGAPDANDGKKNAGGDKGGKKDGTKANTPNAASENKFNPPPTPTPVGTPAEAGQDAQAAATPTGDATPVAQPPLEGKAGEAVGREDTTDFAATARRLLDRWGLLAAVAGTVLGLVALAVYTVIVGRRVTRIDGELEAIERQDRGSGTVFLPGQASTRPARASADAAPGRGSATTEPTPEGEGQEQAAETQPAAIPADAIDELMRRVAQIENQLRSAEKPPATAPAEAEAEDRDEVKAPPVVRPPERVTVDKMVEWANSAGLRLEPVKATVGLFGKFGRSDDGDNWLAIADGDSYLFPRVKRFESGSHFKSDYLDYYDCDHPSSGTVLVDCPATVSSDPQGGWKLMRKGKLSVVAS